MAAFSSAFSGLAERKQGHCSDWHFTACPITLMNHLPQVPDFATPAGASLACPQTQDYGQAANGGWLTVPVEQLGRGQGILVLLDRVASVLPSCELIGMESCPGSQWLARKPQAMDRVGRIGEMTQKAIPAELGSHQRLAGSCQTDNVKVVFADIDAVYRNFFDWCLHNVSLLQHVSYSVHCLVSERAIPLLLSPERRRCAVQHVRQQYGLSERHACQLLGRDEEHSDTS